MRSSEDSANHEFVFVGGREVYSEGCSAAPASRPGRHHPRPRLNQPIPTSLDLTLTTCPQTWPTSCSSATTTRAKATPLPPELIELLPPHLRENTVPDFSTSPLTEELPPERPPLPTTYCPGDYSNLDDPSTPTTPHNYDYLSDLIASDAFSVFTSSQGHGAGASSVMCTRPTVSSRNTTTSSLSVPAFASTDSGVGSTSISGRREEASMCRTQRPLQPPSPKFARAVPATTSSSSSSRISYTAVLASDGERASMVRRLEALTPSQSPLLDNFRAANGHKLGLLPSDRSDMEGPAHTCHVTTATTSPDHHTSKHTLTSKPLTMSSARSQMATLENKAGLVLEGGEAESFKWSPALPPTTTSHTPLPSQPVLPATATLPGRSCSVPPPSSPETRRAWNVVGVPVREPASRSPSPSSRGDSIYDNLVVRRHPLLATATQRTAPTASVQPIITPHPRPTTGTQHPQPTPATPPRRVTPSPLIGKPPSPPTQRRGSCSPTHANAWKPSSRPNSPHCCPSGGPQYGGCWVPVWGSSPQLFQAAGSVPVYPAYIYSGGLPPGRAMYEKRSYSCDRLPAQSSPPPSPRSGRRSASPWRGGSASPSGHRQSPSSECGSGRPPRPRRPPLRKAKTVEVGCLGVGGHPTVPGVALTSPLHPRAHLTCRVSPSSQLLVQAVDHRSAHAHTRQHLPPHTDNLPEQSHHTGEECDKAVARCSPSPLVEESVITPVCVSPSPVFVKHQRADASKHKSGSLEERVNRLEGDKDSLQLQVTVLSEQVEAQTEKIADLENLLEQKKEQLQKTEEQLQKEVMTRSSLETQRLELFSEISNLKLRHTAYERENIELREKIRRSEHQSDHVKAQLSAQLSSSPSPSSISTLSTIPASSPNKSSTQPITASPAPSSTVASHDAREYMPPRTPPPNARRKIDQFGTVPRQREVGMYGENTHGTPATGRAKGVMFGKGFHFLPFRVAGKRSTSAPNLAETEMQMIDDLPEGEYYQQGDGVITPVSSSPRCNTLSGHRSPPMPHKATGIKKIFTRLRRSSSGHLDGDLGEGDFRRGGMRATASARLGWTSPSTSFKEPSEGFVGWNIETMEAWLGALGLNQYCSSVRAWSSSGHHLSRATPQQLERELGIRHPLHRKKLQLAIAARLSGDQINTPLTRLDHSWVLRWLDDVGLPQYKDAFSEARIDGRVLNCLTYDDLSFLRLSNLLHVTSLKRGIQVLREHNFDPSVLKRRSVPDEGQRTRTAAEVALWTNHRVMEWLRTVDLSEYAPNLRGSGVHGALMVYEVRFTSELLASLLSIPCGKTLLRRHLNTHFKELVGRSVVQEKRQLEAASGYTPLTTSAKVKMPKKSQFSLKRKKSKSDLEFDDLLCPLDEKPPIGAMLDKKKEVRTGEVENINSLMIEEEVEKKLSTVVVEETNGDDRLC